MYSVVDPEFLWPREAVVANLLHGQFSANMRGKSKEFGLSGKMMEKGRGGAQMVTLRSLPLIKGFI